MPLYDFECRRCKNKVERLLPMDAPNPICCGEEMHKGTGSISMVYWNFNQTNSLRTPKDYDAKKLAAMQSHNRQLEYA